MASEDLLKKAVAAFNALTPEQQAEMLEEQRQSWVRGNIGLSRDERGMTSPVMPRPTTVMANELKPVLPSTLWQHYNGNKYEVLLLSNTESERQEKYPTTVVYRNISNGNIYSRKLSDWHRSMTHFEESRPAPAATDTGLETVRYEIVETLPSGTTRWKCVEHKLMANSIALNNEYPSVVNALCRRSQAAELLAAKDAEIAKLSDLVESWSDMAINMEKHIDKLKADNAAQAARIKELEERIEAENLYQHEALEEDDARVEALEAKLAAAHERERVLLGQVDAAGDTIRDLKDKIAATKSLLTIWNELPDNTSSAGLMAAWFIKAGTIVREARAELEVEPL